MYRFLPVRPYCSAILIHLLLLPCISFASQKRMYAHYSVDQQDLERFELRIAQQLWKTKSNIQNRTDDDNFKNLVDSYLQDYLETSEFAHNSTDPFANAETYASNNPVCVYRLLRRVHTSLKILVSHPSFSRIFSQLSGQVGAFFLGASWPNETDVTTTITTILRLQQVYDLRADQLANGWVSDVPNNCILNSDHCKEIALVSNRSQYYTYAIEWMEQAKEKALIDKKVNADVIDSSLKNIIQAHNRYVFGMNGWEPRFFNRKIRDHIPGDWKNVTTKRNALYELYKGVRERNYNIAQFWGLCSGDNLQTEQEKSYLFCWYEFKIHPSFAIGPVKMEFLARNPDVVQMYDVLNTTSIKTIKLETGPRMRESQMVGHDTSTSDWSSGRLSSTAWYRGVHVKELKSKIQRLTGLNLATNNGEPFQVVSYTTGGQYEPHVDAFGETPNTGERMATVMFYITPVEKGGSTAFSSLGVAAQPVVGSAVYWHNIFTDGSKDEDVGVMHGACPVLLGEKWIINKWVVGYDQFHTRKCSLNPRERHRIPVNGMYLPIPKVFQRPYEHYTKNPPVEVIVIGKYNYVAPAGLQALANLEMNLYSNIKKIYFKYRNRTNSIFRQEFDERNKDVKNYLDTFEETANAVGLEHDQQLGAETAQNPLTAFKQIRRFLDYFQIWIKPKPQSDTKLLTRIGSYLTKVYNGSDGPGVSDVESVMFAILNIQSTYDLSVKDISVGIVDGINTRVTLNAKDCALIGQHALALKFYKTGIQWMERALYLLQTDSKNSSYDTVLPEDINEELVSAGISHDEDLLKTSKPDPQFFTHSISQFMEPTGKMTNQFIRHEDWESKNSSLTINRFSGICNGRFHQTNAELSTLFCWYEREIHPSYKIGPIKAEFLSTHEGIDVVQYHNVVNDAAITSLTNLTHPDSELIFYNPVRSNNSQRQSKSITTRESKAVTNLVELAQRLTGLKAKRQQGQEQLVVSAYTPGGYFGEHLEKSKGAVASFMFYLSDVRKGGETVFVNSGAKAVPTKGSAVFWYSRFSNGKLNRLTRHGDCPVIFGEKWTALWIAYYNQQNHLQCHLQPLTPPQVLVNGNSKYLKKC